MSNVLKEFHDDAGHAAGAQLSHLIQSAGMDWEGCYSDCCNYRKKCEICDKYKAIKGNEGLLEPMMKSELEGKSVLHIDFIGPLPETSEKYKFVCISITKEDKWVELTAHKEQNAKEVIKHLDARAERESAWDVIISDRGSPFINDATETWLKDAGVEQRATTAANPMANGEAESEVKNMKEVAIKMLDGKREWAQCLGKIAQYLRFKERSDSRMSAYEQRPGKPMRLPNHLKFGADEPRSLSATEQRKAMTEIYKKEDQRALKQKEAYDKKKKEPKYKEGERVWLRVHEPVTFGPKREGPFVILEKILEVNYQIGEIGKTKLQRHPVVNVKHIANYNAEVEEEAEAKVEKVLSHRKTRRGFYFKVKWADGENTEIPMDNFVDVLEGGEKRWNEELKAYARQNGIRLLINSLKHQSGDPHLASAWGPGA